MRSIRTLLAVLTLLVACAACASSRVAVQTPHDIAFAEVDTVGLRVTSAATIARPHVPTLTTLLREELEGEKKEKGFAIGPADEADLVLEATIVEFDPGDPGEKAAGLGGDATIAVRVVFVDGATAEVLGELRAEGDSKSSNDASFGGVMTEKPDDLPLRALRDVADAIADWVQSERKKQTRP